MTNRQKFCKAQQESHPFKPEILSPVPDFVELGEGVHIAEGVIFAPHGFGYEQFNGKYELIPHCGKIIIEDNVYIHENTVIVRGTVDATIIGEGTKIDGNVHITHNCKIGKNCLIISGTTLGGSVTIGDYCYLGIGSTVRNKITIGNKVLVGMGAVVVKDIPEGQTVIGNPAKEMIW